MSNPEVDLDDQHEREQGQKENVPRQVGYIGELGKRERARFYGAESVEEQVEFAGDVEAIDDGGVGGEA